ncbi:MAG: tRNA dihydrouridine synthase DusB [Holosporaceae bacterium]|jgi:tRNA-dihydrouridine synthase B|nr:tRNA dihydrouridine synthase DusB [Holosporaceae bacterium]
MTKIESLYKNAVFLAPMAGVTDAPFRDLVASFGATATTSEMAASEALVRNSEKTRKRLESKDGNLWQVVQIMGADPKNMAESARIAESFGADAIDVNMGCPARKIVSNESGSALMKNEKLAVEIAESVAKAVKIPVTVKMRLGWDAQHINFLSLAKKFEEVGAQALAIHCRTRAQMYSGKADWTAIAELKDAIKIPYLCNGDIKSGEDAAQALTESRADGVMIGREALGKPWILNQIMKFLESGEIVPSPSLEEQFQIIMNHFEAVMNFYGENRGIKLFRKHFCYYSGGLSGASSFRETINRAEDVSFIKNCVEDFYKGRFKAIL